MCTVQFSKRNKIGILKNEIRKNKNLTEQRKVKKKVKNRTNRNKILGGRNMSKNINTHNKCEQMKMKERQIMITI